MAAETAPKVLQSGLQRTRILCIFVETAFSKQRFVGPLSLVPFSDPDFEYFDLTKAFKVIPSQNRLEHIFKYQTSTLIRHCLQSDFVAVYSRVWLCMALYGFMWPCMIFCGLWSFCTEHSGVIPSRSAGMGKKLIQGFFGFLAKISSI